MNTNLLISIMLVGSYCFRMQRPPPVVLKAKDRHTATLIFLHGLGDTGHGWAAAFNMIKPKYLKVVCPTAPTAPVSLNFGMAMPSWYDIFHLDDDPSRPREDMEGVKRSAAFLSSMIEAETGPDIPRNRIMIGGFSQGGAVSLSTLFENPDIAGCIALSTYVPGNKKPELASQIGVPILQCHGEDDEMISLHRGKLTNEIIKSLAKDVQFHTFPHMGHESTMEEMEIVKRFILDTLGPE